MPTGIYRRNNGIIGSPAVTKHCRFCGKEFKAKASQAERRHYCSYPCRNEGRSMEACVTKQCVNCGKDFLSQPYRKVTCCSEECTRARRAVAKRKHPSGWCVQQKAGYIVRTKNRRTELQHRVVMEAKLGRPLAPFENVHHINGVRDDNRPENLEVWVTKQPKGQRPEDLIAWAAVFLRHHGWTCTAPQPL